MQGSKTLFAGGAAGGILIEYLSTRPFHVHIFSWLGFGWLYQLIIGLLMAGIGWFTLRISGERMPPFSLITFRVMGFTLGAVGVFIAMNVDRYQEAFVLFGTWPVFAIGVWITAVSCISLGHSLSTP